MSLARLVVFLTLLILILPFHDARKMKDRLSKRTGKKSKGSRPKVTKPPPVQLNMNAVPTIKEILEEVDMLHLFPDLIKMGVTETRLLLRLQPMDFRMMELEWGDNYDAEKVAVLKTTIEKYHDIAAKAAVTEVKDVRNPERDKLLYGRMVIPRSVQSFEYASASFGGQTPRGGMQLVVDSYPHFGCPEDINRDDEELDFILQSDIEKEERRKEIRRKSMIAPELPKLTAGEMAQLDAELVKNNTISDLSGLVLAVRRGQCSYLQKALYAVKRNASGLVIVNIEDRVDAPASGLGIEADVKQVEVNRVSGMPIFSLSNITWAKLQYAISPAANGGGAAVSEKAMLQAEAAAAVDGERSSESNVPLPLLDAFGQPYQKIPVQFIPMKCGGKVARLSGSQNTCTAVEPAEKAVQQEITWGTIKVTSTSMAATSGQVITKTFQFLTSNFGSVLPYHVPTINSQTQTQTQTGNNEIELLMSVPANACEELAFVGLGMDKAVGVVVERGGCPFQTKVMNVERAGGSVAIIIDTADQPLQRIGGVLPETGYVGMPAILVTQVFGEFIKSNIGGENAITAEIVSADNDVAASAWIDLAFYAWSDDANAKLMQLQSLIQKYIDTGHDDYVEISAWLNRKMKETEIEIAGVNEL